MGRTIFKYLPGLNGLRAIAALLVVVHHTYQSAIKIGLAHPLSYTVIFDRGKAAVDFFFTLSGFLITYLLFQEREKTGTVSLKGFYLRRVYRIWPLYYIIVIFGFVIFAGLYPLIYHKPYFEFELWRGLVLFVLFLPHLMVAYYKVGLLLPLWSIGVEEQFYLFWAPFVKWFGRHVLALVGSFIIITVAFNAAVRGGLFRDEHIAIFAEQLRFHYMAIGSFFAYLLFYHGEWYRHSFAASRWFQAIAAAVILYQYIIGFPVQWGITLDVALSLFYGVLILGVSVAPKPLVNLEREPLNYLGKISYGIYMYHMMADYFVRTGFIAAGIGGAENVLLTAAYSLIVAGIAVATAHVSYRYVESRFLALGHRSAKTAQAVAVRQ